MLANIYLKQNELKPTKWNEDWLAQENIHRGDYIKALKQAPIPHITKHFFV
jgi:hypothetical protein